MVTLWYSSMLRAGLRHPSKKYIKAGLDFSQLPSAARPTQRRINSTYHGVHVARSTTQRVVRVLGGSHEGAPPHSQASWKPRLHAFVEAQRYSMAYWFSIRPKEWIFIQQFLPLALESFRRPWNHIGHNNMRCIALKMRPIL